MVVIGPSLYTITVILASWIWQCMRWWSRVVVIFDSPECLASMCLLRSAPVLRHRKSSRSRLKRLYRLPVGHSVIVPISCRLLIDS